MENKREAGKGVWGMKTPNVFPNKDSPHTADLRLYAGAEGGLRRGTCECMIALEKTDRARDENGRFIRLLDMKAHFPYHEVQR